MYCWAQPSALLQTLLIFPDKPDLEFPKRVLPLLKIYPPICRADGTFTPRKPSRSSLSLPERATLERTWANRDDYFPVWVFEPGFNPALRPGQYFFVVHLGQISEILFALNHFVRHQFEPELLRRLAPPLRAAVLRTQELFLNIIALLEGKKIGA